MSNIDPQFEKLIDSAQKEIDRMISEKAKKALREQLQREFADFDCETLPGKTNKELAAWQAKYPMDSPQYIIALQEWNRRAIVRQTRWMKFSAILAAITALASVFIGDILRENRERHKQPQSIEVICTTPPAPTIQAPTGIKTSQKSELRTIKKRSK